jgi:poly(hydroxyalkanoate) granule-associated protein
MVKKMKTQGEKQSAENIMELTRLIWLAGLGAFAMVEEEGGKLFENLVKEGERFEERTKKVADDTVEDVRDKVEEVKDKAISTWDKLEEVLEDRVARILNRLGVPTRKDVEDLSKRVEVLNETVKKLTKG